MREEIQYEAIKSWLETKKGTIVLPTGVGKTYVGATIAVKQLLNNSISTVLIVVPTVSLVKQWREEIIKFYGEDIMSSNSINISCLQTVYKQRNYVDLLIIDEIHTSLSEKYSSVFTNTYFKQLLGLTATIPNMADKKNKLSLLCPIVFNKELKEISNSSVVSKYEIFNLATTMSKSESGKYRLFDGKLKRAQMEIGFLKIKDKNLKGMQVFDIAKLYATSKDKTPLVKYSKEFWASMGMRKSICYNALSKINYVLEILKSFPEKKWIIFNKSIDYAEKLKETIGSKAVIYHSKMKDGERDQALQDFANNKFSILVAVDALNAGLNVPEVDGAISVSGVSTELTNIQQLGRILRFKENKKALFINLYCKNTVEENWVKSKTKNLDVKWISNVKMIN